jgi:hypothetical protein
LLAQKGSLAAALFCDVEQRAALAIRLNANITFARIRFRSAIEGKADMTVC